jgi:outer membrane protein TolC
MNRKKLNVILIILLFIAGSVNLHAQQRAQGELTAGRLPVGSGTPVRITPDEAVDMAIKNNLSLLSSQASLDTRKRASQYSWNQFIPELTAAGFLRRDNLVTTAGTAPYTVDLPQWSALGGTIQASFTVSPAMFENMRRLRLDYESGLIAYDKAKLQLERDIRKAYHNMLLLQENIALLRSAFENVERQMQMAQANYNAGLAPELTYLQARVGRENMLPVIDQAESGLRLSMSQFAMFLGMDFDTPFELTPINSDTDFLPVDVTEMIRMAAAEKPEIRELRHTITMLESAKRTQTLSLSPALSISWNNTWALPYPFDSSFGGNSWVNTGGTLTISIGWRLHSLIPFSQDFQAIKNLDNQLQVARIGLSQMVIGTEIEIYNTVLSLEKTRITADAQAQTVRLAEQTYNLTLQAYQAGLQDFFQVQSAQQQLQQAQVQMLEQQFNFINGLIDLEYSIGVPFGTLSGRSR